MKPAEIRIGNCVYSGNTVIEVTPTIFNSFLNGSIELMPILLDEEWLKKLDFYEFHYEDSKSRWFSNDVIELELKKYGRFIFKTFEVDYVHQLQNIYLDLTGDELVSVKDTPGEI